MPKLVFRGTHIRYFDTRQSQNGEAVFVRVHCSADFTDVIREAMEWAELPDSFSEGKLSGEIAAERISMKPSQKQMLALAFELNVKEVRDFKVVTVSDGEDSSHRELRFVVVTSEDGAYTTIGDFLRVGGQAKCAMTVTYSQQTTVMDPPAEETQGTLQEVQ